MTSADAASATTHQVSDEAMTVALAGIEREFETLVTQVRRRARRNAQFISDGMLPGAYKVFTTIARAECVTLSELTEVLMVDKGQMSRTVRELDERGLITRAPDPHDGRSVLLSASEYGLERLKEVQSDQQNLLRSSMQSWSLADLDRFTELLHALAHGQTP